jgi:regulator of extracellular matrix RemA (YlzA/DUF370 family)
MSFSPISFLFYQGLETGFGNLIGCGRIIQVFQPEQRFVKLFFLAG